MIQLLVMFSALVSLQVAFSSGSLNASPFQVVTSYSYSEVPVSTITWTSTAEQVLVSTAFQVPSPTGEYGCNIIYDNFTAPAGPISGTMTATSPVDFYLVSEPNYAEWVSLHPGCSGPMTALPGIRSATSYSFTANLPQSGEYFLLFINYSKTSTALVVVTVNSVGSPVTYTTTSNSMYFQTVVFTQAYTTPFSTYSSTPSSVTTSTMGSVNPYYTAIEIGIIGLIVAGAVLAFVYGGKKTSQRAREPSEKRSSTKPSKVSLGKQFCLECGNELPQGSKFCNKCGTKQTG